MRLSDYTDYSLRVLMHCAAQPGQRSTIAGLAQHHGLSRNHLMKVVNALARQGLLETTRGRGGGLRLLKPPQDIRVGDVVRAAETDFRLVACFRTPEGAAGGAGRASGAALPATAGVAAATDCRFIAHCRLRQLLGDALQAWFTTLDGATLADLVVGMPAASLAPSPLAGPAPRRRPALPALPVLPAT